MDVTRLVENVTDALGGEGGKRLLLLLLILACMVGTVMKVDGAREWGTLCLVALTAKGDNRKTV